MTTTLPQVAFVARESEKGRLTRILPPYFQVNHVTVLN
jgi:hypothetical protein